MALGAGRKAVSTPMQLTRIVMHRPRNQVTTHLFSCSISFWLQPLFLVLISPVCQLNLQHNGRMFTMHLYAQMRSGFSRGTAAISA